MHHSVSSPHGPELTGRTVLVILLAFFGIVVGVNIVLMRAAAVTFGGLETESSYKAGLTFKQEASSSQAQNARGWRVEAALAAQGEAGTQIEITARDAIGEPIPNLDLAFTLARPTDKRLDVAITMDEVSPGRFRGVAKVPTGQWEFVITLSRGGERLFRSQNRVVLR